MTHLENLSRFISVPETSVPEWALVVVSSLDEDGGQRSRYALLGEPSIATVLGTLDIVQHDLQTRE